MVMLRRMMKELARVGGAEAGRSESRRGLDLVGAWSVGGTYIILYGSFETETERNRQR